MCLVSYKCINWFIPGKRVRIEGHICSFERKIITL
jgi:hypothetical protein